MKQLHPRTVWLFFIEYLLAWLILAIVGVFSLLVVISDLNGAYNGNTTMLWLAITFLVILVLSYGLAELTYHFYRWDITTNTFRKQFGIIWRHEISIPYDRIQNIDLYQGIIGRLLGLADVRIQTAGYHSDAARFSEGYLPGLILADAQKLRDELVKRARSTPKEL